MMLSMAIPTTITMVMNQCGAHAWRADRGCGEAYDWGGNTDDDEGDDDGGADGDAD